MENIGGIFVVLICGLIIAVFVAIMEFVWSTRRSTETDEVCPHTCPRRSHRHTPVGSRGTSPILLITLFSVSAYVNVRERAIVENFQLLPPLVCVCLCAGTMCYVHARWEECSKMWHWPAIASKVYTTNRKLAFTLHVLPVFFKVALPLFRVWCLTVWH